MGVIGLKKKILNHINRYKLHWASAQIGDGIGNAFGYTKHERNLRRYVKKIADFSTSAKSALTIISPEQYNNPPSGYLNFLFTMFEGTTLPDEYIKNMHKADYLIAPSTWVKDRFNQYFPAEKTFVCPHGVTDEYKYFRRALPGEKGRPYTPFMYLWAGAPNPRKGYETIVAIWQKTGFLNHPGFLLYVKTTRINKIEQKGNVILDGRTITDNQMINLYHRAHCFVMPTAGEGFGLMLAEAMRTGLPCICTNYSGVTDFFDASVGYPVDYELGDGTVSFPATGTSHKTQIARPNPIQVFEHMINIRQNYYEALEKGRLASERISRDFTWGRSAKILVDGMKDKE